MPFINWGQASTARSPLPSPTTYSKRERVSPVPSIEQEKMVEQVFCGSEYGVGGAVKFTSYDKSEGREARYVDRQADS